MHAHRDAAAAALQALDLWPRRRTPQPSASPRSTPTPTRAELAGDLAEATRALREAAAPAARARARRRRSVRALGATARRLAGLYELQGDRERALLARRAAAAARSTVGGAARRGGGRAAASLAAYGQSAGRHGEAVELALAAAADAQLAERSDLRARALGLEGVARAKRGEFAEGVETIRAGLRSRSSTS